MEREKRRLKMPEEGRKLELLSAGDGKEQAC